MRKIALIVVCLTLGITGVALAATLFTGRTSQSLPITLSVHKGKMDMHYTADYTCTGGGHPSTPQPTTVTGVVLHNGSWSGGETVGTNDRVHTSGQISGNTATGNFKETYVSKAHHTCKSGKVKFTARR